MKEHICEYGCGQKANYQFKNGKWCCEDNWSRCLYTRNKISVINKRFKLKNKYNVIKNRINNEWTEDQSRFYLVRILTKILRQKAVFEFCEYGCGQKAIYKQSNGKWCCSKNYRKCPSNKKKYGSPGKKNPMFGKKHSNKTINKMKKSRVEKGFRYTLKDYKEKHPIFYKEETLRFDPNNNLELQVKCKFCKKWFTPTKLKLAERIRANNKLMQSQQAVKST